LSNLSPKKNQKVLMKIEEMADVFINSANFAPHAFLTLAPPSGYALNLKALMHYWQEVVKVMGITG
jgi:hypothetical protein